MKNQAKFEKLRAKYPEFIYRSFKVREDAQAIYLDYEFEIPKLAKFKPSLKILKKHLDLKSIIGDAPVRNLAFQIGMVELVSYWKSSCAPKVIIECGFLDAEQIEFWKKTYFYGLGEMFYTNGIETTREEFMTIEIAENVKKEHMNGRSLLAKNSTMNDGSLLERAEARGNLVLIGGGKDSNVTMDLLPINPHEDFVMIVNPKPVTRACAAVAGVPDEHVVEVIRKIDGRLLELNKDGFLNGHTPFSSFLAFMSYLVAYLLGLKYVVVSNESSANEGNVKNADGFLSGAEKSTRFSGDLCKKAQKTPKNPYGFLEDVNHQYSKSFEFEEDFRKYARENLGARVEYYSFLRPLNELQIAKLFAAMPQYHAVFKSCNVGSKGEDWKWCNDCAKCLFAFVILRVFLNENEIVKIFGEDLYAKENLWKTLEELAGHGATKPFDCVGTFAEVRWAVRKVINDGGELPILLKKYAEKYGDEEAREDLLKEYNAENNLTPEQNAKLKKALGIR